jgi:transposase-like protein
MRSRRHPPVRAAPSSAFSGYRFPPEVITLAVRWYLRFGLSYRDVEELLAERGIEVDHVSIYRWVHRFAPEFAEGARARQHVIGDRWHVDETYLKVGGAWRYVFRAIDQFGRVIDVLLSPRRDAKAARRFLVRIPALPLSTCGFTTEAAQRHESRSELGQSGGRLRRNLGARSTSTASSMPGPSAARSDRFGCRRLAPIRDPKLAKGDSRAPIRAHHERGRDTHRRGSVHGDCCPSSHLAGRSLHPIPGGAPIQPDAAVQTHVSGSRTSSPRRRT